MDVLEDKYLMQKVQEGDLSKMALLYERHHRDLFGYFYRLTNHATKSEDLVQSVFYRLIKYRHTYRGEGKFVYWMYSIAKNIWLDRLKKKNIIAYDGDELTMAQHPDHARNAEDLLLATERKNLLKQALQQLSPEKREAIVLSKFQGLKYQEIAQMANCTENAIKSRVQRGLLELKDIMLKLENR
jgi:RNA polymerase sigma-70 factor (ECF subfamily)